LWFQPTLEFSSVGAIDSVIFGRVRGHVPQVLEADIDSAGDCGGQCAGFNESKVVQRSLTDIGYSPVGRFHVAGRIDEANDLKGPSLELPVELARRVDTIGGA